MGKIKIKINMNLEEFIGQINEADEDLIIFQKEKQDINSEVALFKGGQVENGVLTVGGQRYYYLLEVFLAKEFIEDWVNSLTYRPTDKEIAIRLWEYAINDA
jgi:hypothetical protein